MGGQFFVVLQTPIMDNKKTRIAAYIRVSRTKQEFFRQISDLKAEAKRRGFIIQDDDIYAEKITGFSKGNERHEFNRMMERIRSGEKKYSMVYCTEISRIARRPKWGRQILEELTDHKVSLFFPTIGTPSLDETGKPNKMFNIIFGILLEFAETEIDTLVQRSQSGRAERARQGGGFAGVYLPYGLKKNDDRILIIDEEEQEVVREIYDYCLKGLGTLSIANILNQRGIPTRFQKAMQGKNIKYKTGKKLVDSMEWTNATVHGILKNPIYCGKRLHKGEVVDSPVIIEEDKWLKVQDVLKDRNNVKSKDTVYLYLLKGKIKCSKCGRNYFAKYRPGKEDFYMCSTNKMKRLCPNCGISIQAGESSVWNVVSQSSDFYKHLSNTSANQHIKDEIEALKLKLSMEQANLQSKEGEMERTLKLFQKGLISENRLEDESIKIERQINTVHQQIDKVKKTLKTRVEALENLTSRNSLFKKIREIGTDRYKIKEVLDVVLEKVIVTAVNTQINNNDYLVSIYLKDIPTPQHIVLKTKPRNIHADLFINPTLQESIGNKSFKYFRNDIDGLVTYEQDILQTKDVKSLVDEMLNKTSKWTSETVPYPLTFDAVKVNTTKKVV
jgi:site-specific DNA recombinase